MARLITPSQKKEIHLPEGLTLQQAIDVSIEEGLRDHLVVYNFGMEVTDRSFVIRRSDSLVLAVVPQGGGGGGGGKSILGAILMIALVVTAPYLAGAMGFTGLGASAVAMGISMVGGLAISALVRPPDITPQNSASYDQSPTYSLSGQSNQGRAYAPVAKIYGRHKYFPNLASSPIISNLGSESRIASLYDFGYGDIHLEEFKIGDSPAEQFSPELYIHQNSLVKNTVYVTRRVGYDQFQYKLIQNSPVQIRSKPKAIQFDVDIAFSRGLYRFDDKGNLLVHSIDVNFQYRPVGGAWIDIGAESVFGVDAQYVSGNVRLTGSTTRPFVAVVSITTPFAGDFDFKAVKISADNTDSKFGEDATITMIKSYSEGSVVNLEKPHTMVEMRILATDKISGSVQNFSAIATSILRVTDDGVNFRLEPTRNPAWIAVDILTGIATPKALPDDLIDWESWIALARHCDGMGYHSDFVVDYSTTVLELLNSVLGVARASFTMTLSGKYGCLIDVKKSVPRQLITPANSRNFGGSRNFSDRPHAFLVSYVDPEMNWQKNQRPVYFDGWNEFNSTIFEDLDTFGITSADEAWRFGRFMMAQGIHRAETFSVEMDVENLVVQRGDLVHVAHDVPKLGGIACRVVECSENNITINQELSVEPTGYTIRLSDGTIKTGNVLGYLNRGIPMTLRGWEKTLSKVDPIAQRNLDRLVYVLDDATGIEPDDLIVMGVFSRVTNPYLVTAINPSQDLTATISLVKYVPEVYDADLGDIPEWNPDFGDDMINGAGNLKIIDLFAENVMIYPARYPINQIQLNWMITGFNYHHADIYVTTPDGKKNYVGESKSFSFYQVYSILQNLQLIGEFVAFEVVPVTAGGIVGESDTAFVQIFADRTPPAIPEGFGVNIQSEQVSIFWSLSNEPDLLRYEVRFTPEVLFPEWSQSQLIGFTNWDVNRITAGARTGTYMIMAYDSSDNQSEIAYQRTSIDSLPNVEIVTDINDQITNWLGELHHLVTEPVKTDKFISEWRSLYSVKYMSEVLAGVTALTSEGDFGNIYPEGVYYFEKLITFDRVYEVRISSYIQAHGEQRQGSRWNYNKASPLTLTYVDPSLWDVWLEYRCVDEFDFMVDWASMNSVSSLFAEDNKWSEWRVITVGDVTGRVLQFRIHVISKSKDVKVYVTDGSVEINVADRVWSLNDVVIPAEGKRINYDLPFMFDETAIAVNIDGNESPAKSIITNKNRMGFDVSLVHLLDQTPLAGKIDVLVRGQGKERNNAI